MRLLALFSFDSRTGWRWRWVLGLMLALLALSSPALADDDPFQLELSSWMSFDRYKEKPSVWIAPDERAAAVLEPVVVPSPTMPSALPIVTLLTRSVIAPVMPGINKGFDVRVNSTEDDHRTLESVLSDSDNRPVLDLQGKEWKNATEVARLSEGQKQTLTDDADHTSLDVRFSYLPAQIEPAPKQTPMPARKIEMTQVAKAPPPTSAPTVDPAVCAALDAYKKRQLAALESDRKTLAALQDAIAQLGLQKQLDFMTDAGGKLNMESSTAKTDLSAAATKN